jgi:hypothetical protein
MAPPLTAWKPVGQHGRRATSERTESKKRRSDFGKKHNSTKRRLASHLTEADKDALSIVLVDAAAELASDSIAEDGPSGPGEIISAAWFADL